MKILVDIANVLWNEDQVPTIKNTPRNYDDLPSSKRRRSKGALSKSMNSCHNMDRKVKVNLQ